MQQIKECDKNVYQSMEKSNPEVFANIVIPSIPKVNSASSSEIALLLLFVRRAAEREGDDGLLRTDDLIGGSIEIAKLFRLGVDVLKQVADMKGSSRPIASFWL